MKLGLLDMLDTKGMSEEDVKRFEQMDEVLGEAFNKKMIAYLKDEVKMEELHKSVEEAMKSIQSLEEAGKKALDEKVFNEAMKSMNETLVRLKAATEVKGNGEVAFKSVEEQLFEQLKSYVSVDKNGIQTLDLKAACQASAGNKLNLDIVLNTKDAAVIASGALAPHYNVEIDPRLGVQPRSESVIRRYASVAPTRARSIVYADYVSKEGDAAWVQEGGLKPIMDATLTEKTVTAGKVAIAAKFTEETLSDFPTFVNEVQIEMVNKLGIKEEQGILNGTGEDGEIKGVAADMPAFSLANFQVDNANMYDAIVASYTQILSASEMAYRPNLVLMNPVDYAKMQLTKDANGQYLRPFKAGDELIQGLRIESTTAVEAGSFKMGDFSYLNIRDLWQLQISIGWENNDFRKNIVTVLAEKRLMAYIKTMYKTAFVADEFATVIEAITKTA